MPRISIVLPVYNAESTIIETLDSILAQTYGDFELLVINDGSTDRSEMLIRQYNDSRIEIIENERNQGLIYSLNRGVAAAKGKYIARMDSDDVMDPDRLNIQYEYMETHPDIAICGNFISIFNASGLIGKQIYGVTDDEVKAEMLFNSPICHPSFFARSEVFKQFKYDTNYKYCEDYELLTRLLDKNKGCNIPRCLLKYRVSDHSQTAVGEKNTVTRYNSISRIQNRLLHDKLGIDNDLEDQSLHYSLSLSSRISEMNDMDIEHIRCYFKKLIAANSQKGYCCSWALKFSLGKIWLKLIHAHILKLDWSDRYRIIFSRYTYFGTLYMIRRLTCKYLTKL